MKRTKTIFSLALALVLSLALSISVFAAGTKEDPYVGGYDYASGNGSIQLHKLDIAGFEKSKAEALIAGGTLAAGGKVTYKGNTPLGTSLSSGDVVGTYTTTADSTPVDVTLGQLAALGNITFRIEQVQLGSGKTPGSTTPTDYDPVATGIDGYAKTEGTGLISWTGLPKGYYRVTEQANDTAVPVDSGSYIVSLPMVDPVDNTQTLDIVHLYPKNRAAGWPFIEKEKPSLADYNGNILSWTIKSEIPAGLKAEQGKQRYVVTDTMSQGIEFAGNLKVYYLASGGKVELAKGTDYSAPAQNGDTTLTITLQSTGFAKLGGALPAGIDKDAGDRYILYITYDTVVNITEADLESGTDPENKVKLDFTNSDGTAYENNPGPVVVENYAGLRLIKKDGANETVLLPGAKFKVYTKLASGGTAVDTNSVLKDAEGNEREFTTDAEGEFFYAGLGAGSYYVVETAPPANYKQLSGFTTIVISDTDVEGNKVKEATVLNYLNNGLTLPSTGGAGTLLFLVGGIVLIAAAGAVFLLSRKRGRSGKGNR